MYVQFYVILSCVQLPVNTDRQYTARQSLCLAYWRPWFHAQCMYTRAHTIHNNFINVKFFPWTTSLHSQLPVSLQSPPALTHGNPQSFLCLYNFAFSKMSYKLTYTAYDFLRCILFSISIMPLTYALDISEYHHIPEFV